MTLAALARRVLLTADADAKAALTLQEGRAWQMRLRLGLTGQVGLAQAPDRPERPARPELVAPGAVPTRRRGGNAENRIALLHALAHIELNAVDMSWDAVARFSALGPDGVGALPQDFFADWLQVAVEEATHFTLLQARLRALGSEYGALPAHDGLWQAAAMTAGDVAARMAICPMVLEARGLDVTPCMVQRFASQGDADSAAILQRIHDEEIGHVAIGKRWFDYLAAQAGAEPRALWQELVERYFKGRLKPPFNRPSRDRADFPADWYEPLAQMLD